MKWAKDIRKTTEQESHTAEVLDAAGTAIPVAADMVDNAEAELLGLSEDSDESEAIISDWDEETDESWSDDDWNDETDDWDDETYDWHDETDDWDDEIDDEPAGPKLLEHAETLVANGQSFSSADSFLEHLLAKARLLDALNHTGRYLAADIFDAMVFDTNPTLKNHIEANFDVGLPGTTADIEPGSLMIRRALGEGKLTHAAVITSLSFSADDSAESSTLEGDRLGFYAQVIEPRQGLQSTFARKVLDSSGQVPFDTLFLRAREQIAPNVLETTGKPRISSREELTEKLVKEIHNKVSFIYDDTVYNCVHQAKNFVLNLIRKRGGYSIITKKYRDSRNNIKPKAWRQSNLIKTAFAKLVRLKKIYVAYDIEKDTPSQIRRKCKWRTEVFIRPNDKTNVRAFLKKNPQYIKAVGMVDKLVFLEGKNPFILRHKLRAGWYIKREKFKKNTEGIYKKIGEEFVSKMRGEQQKEYIRVESGDILYTAQGENLKYRCNRRGAICTGGSFDLRHAVVVHISAKDPRKISLWGSFKSPGSEEDSNKGSLTLKVRALRYKKCGKSPSKIGYARRIIIKVWKLNIPERSSKNKKVKNKN